MDGGDCAVCLCKDVVLHFHCLDDGNFLAALYGLAFLDVNADDEAGKGTLDGYAGACGLGCCRSRGICLGGGCGS